MPDDLTKESYEVTVWGVTWTVSKPFNVCLLAPPAVIMLLGFEFFNLNKHTVFMDYINSLFFHRK